MRGKDADSTSIKQNLQDVTTNRQTVRALEGRTEKMQCRPSEAPRYKTRKKTEQP
jgi:hypothetical protein